jgi:hypothetical protein
MLSFALYKLKNTVGAEIASFFLPGVGDTLKMIRLRNTAADNNRIYQKSRFHNVVELGITVLVQRFVTTLSNSETHKETIL